MPVSGGIKRSASSTTWQIWYKRNTLIQKLSESRKPLGYVFSHASFARTSAANKARDTLSSRLFSWSHTQSMLPAIKRRLSSSDTPSLRRDYDENTNRWIVSCGAVFSLFAGECQVSRLPYPQKFTFSACAALRAEQSFRPRLRLAKVRFCRALSTFIWVQRHAPCDAQRPFLA